MELLRKSPVGYCGHKKCLMSNKLEVFGSKSRRAESSKSYEERVRAGLKGERPIWITTYVARITTRSKTKPPQSVKTCLSQEARRAFYSHGQEKTPQKTHALGLQTHIKPRIRSLNIFQQMGFFNFFIQIFNYTHILKQFNILKEKLTM